MKTANYSLINGVILIIFGVWGYLSSETPSPTALIPTFFGAIILSTNYGMRTGRKGFRYAALILTSLVILGLFKPLGGVFSRQDPMGILRVSIMILSSAWAVFFLAKGLFGRAKSTETS